MPLLRSRPAMSKPDALLVGLLLREVGEDAPFEHDQYPVGQGEDFAELRRHQEDRAAAVALGDKLRMDVFGRADIQPPRRLLRDQRRRFMRELARNHDLLQVAARQRSDVHAFVGDLDGEAPDERARPVSESGRIDEGSAGERSAAMKTHCEIVGGGCGRRGARRQRDPPGYRRGRRRDAPRHRPRVTSAPADLDLAAIRLAQADQRLDEFVLTVARDARDADNLAATHGQAHVDRPRARRKSDAIVTSTALRSSVAGLRRPASPPSD